MREVIDGIGVEVKTYHFTRAGALINKVASARERARYVEVTWQWAALTSEFARESEA